VLEQLESFKPVRAVFGNIDDLELRSEEVQEILTRIPHWMIRWGNVVIITIVVLMFTFAWVIRYPDIISTQIVITTEIPPERLTARSSGKLETILIDDKSMVTKNTPIAIIENSANYRDVFLLKNVIDTIDVIKSDFPFRLFRSVQLGEIESAFAAFQKEYRANRLNNQLQPYKVEGNSQSMEAIQLKERLSLLISQQGIRQSELVLEKKDFERHQLLFNKGIISSQDLEKHNLAYLQSQRAYKDLLNSISQLRSSINQLNTNSKQTAISNTKEVVTLEGNMEQSFYQLKKAIKDWELNYAFISSIDGKVTFLQIWNENQIVSAGENAFSIVPATPKGYVGKIKAPALNSGKIKAGQDVNIRLNNYPDREFGILQGKINSISLVPDKEGNLLINVSLPKKLVTSYKKAIPFQQEMSGQAEIITEDLSLAERILYEFRDLFKR